MLTSGSVDGIFLLFFCSTSLSLDESESLEDSEDETSHNQFVVAMSEPSSAPSVLDFLFFDLCFFSNPRGPFCAAMLLFFVRDKKVLDCSELKAYLIGTCTLVWDCTWCREFIESITTTTHLSVETRYMIISSLSFSSV